MPHTVRILIVTLLQSYNVTLRKKMQGPDTDVNAKDYYDGAMELLKK